MLALITLFTTSISIIFILILINNGLRTKSLIIFIFILLMFVLWTVSNYYSLNITYNSNNIFWIRSVMSITALLMLSVIQLGNYFPNNKPFYKSTTNNIIIIIYIILSILGQTNLIIKEISIYDNKIFPVFGIGMIIYIIAIILGVIDFALLMINKYNNGNNIVKKQIFYIGFGLIVTGVFSIITNIIFVLLGFTNLVALGPLFLLIFLSCVFVLLLEGELFNIRLIFGRITYLIVLTTIIVVFYYLSYKIDKDILGGSENIFAIILGIPEAIIFIIFFNSFNKFLLNKIDSTFIHPDYDPREIISDFNKSISTILDYKLIINDAIEILSKTLRSSYEGILIIQDDNYEIFHGKKELKFDTSTILKTNDLWQKINKTPILIDEIDFEFPHKFIDVKQDVLSITEEMRKSDIKALFPLGTLDQNIGMIILGKKNGDEPYTSIEINFLSSISDLAGLALARSFLYKEVKEFSDTLRDKVDDATQEIKDKNQKLEESLHFERDMLDILGHELRTPLGTARNAILLLDMQSKSGTISKESSSKEIAIAVENIRREVQLLETILASTKIDNNKLELKLEKVDCNDVINDSIDGNLDDAKKKNLKLYSVLPKDLLFCFADRLRIQQVMDNLVSNAIKYTKSGEIALSVEKENNMIKFSVKDTGEGIPEEEMPNLGKKFYRINNYLTSEGKIGDRKIVRPGGTGIGLYVVFQLIKAMKGEVKVNSQVSKGSTFMFLLQEYSLQLDNEDQNNSAFNSAAT